MQRARQHTAKEVEEDQGRNLDMETYRELRDGIVDDVECVAAAEVKRNLDDERRTVNHGGLYDQNENLGVTELRVDETAAALASDEPRLAA